CIARMYCRAYGLVYCRSKPLSQASQAGARWLGYVFGRPDHGAEERQTWVTSGAKGPGLASRLAAHSPGACGHGRGQSWTMPWAPPQKIDVDHDGDMIAETGAPPVLEGPTLQLVHPREPLLGQEYVIDMIGGAILPAVPPIEGRRRFLAL